MTVITPPLYLNVDSNYGAADLGLPFRDLIAEGVVGASALQVTERGAGANMSVDVAAGVAWIMGDDSDLQPCYRCLNDGTVNLSIAAADGTNPRVDLVVAEVRDAVFSGVSTDWRLRVVTGTPAGSPATPATPDNAIALATVSVPASDTTIANAQITDVRPRGGLQGGLGVPLVTALPSSPYDGQVVDYLADSSTGAVWRLRYRSAEAGSYKWYFVGGTPLRGENAGTNMTTASASYTDLSTVGPQVTVPLAGDYLCDMLWCGSHNIGGGFGVMAIKVGSAATADAQGILGQAHASNNNWTSRGKVKISSVAASTVLKCQFRSGSGATMAAGNASMGPMFLEALPVRVG